MKQYPQGLLLPINKKKRNHNTLSKSLLNFSEDIVVCSENQQTTMSPLKKKLKNISFQSTFQLFTM